jgi:hypothetical protein
MALLGAFTGGGFISDLHACGATYMPPTVLRAGKIAHRRTSAPIDRTSHIRAMVTTRRKALRLRLARHFRRCSMNAGWPVAVSGDEKPRE